MDANAFDVIGWAAKSPVLNVVENVCDHFVRSVYYGERPYESVALSTKRKHASRHETIYKVPSVFVSIHTVKTSFCD